MNSWLRLPRFLPLGFFAAFVLALVSGCSSQPKIDWDSRIGSFTFDQAVLEFGPPDKQAKLADGTVVAEWMTNRGVRGGSYAVPSGGMFSPYWSYHQTPDGPDYFIRLTFNPEGKLTAHKKFYE
jgi:hypothetical protein